MRWSVFALVVATTGCVGYELRSEAQSLMAAGAGDRQVVRHDENFHDLHVYRLASRRAGLCVITGVRSYRNVRPVRTPFEAFALPTSSGECPTDALAYATLGEGVQVRELHALLSRVRECMEAPDAAACGDLRRPGHPAEATLIEHLDTGMPVAQREGDAISVRYWLGLPDCMSGGIRFKPDGAGWRVASVGCSVGY